MSLANDIPLRHRFELYVAGDAANSLQAIANLSAMCKAHLPDAYQIEVVDVFKQPKRALAEGIFMTPTLLRMAPAPIRKIVGSLSQIKVLLQALGMEGAMA